MTLYRKGGVSFALAAACLFWSAVCGAQARPSITFVDFNGASLPRNPRGEGYPLQYTGEDDAATVSQDILEAVVGKSIKFSVTAKHLYATFLPYHPDGTRGFARDQISNPAAWQFGVYNRLSFWVQSPTNGPALRTTGQENFHVGTYVKEIVGGDPYSDEMHNGNSHYYHHLNIAPTGTWTKVVLNMHPDHLRDVGEAGNLPNPTHEPGYTYWDELTKIYVEQVYVDSASLPAVFRLDEFQFYQEPSVENDEQVFSIAATADLARNRVVLTWARPFADNGIKHEVRYAFQDIHQLGWAAATPAPNGTITPPGWAGYNHMFYDTTQLPLAGHNGQTLYLAIKPQNSSLFSQIALPLGGQDTVAPGAPRNLRGR